MAKVAPSVREVQEALKHLSPHEAAELLVLLEDDKRAVPWRPLPGPQTMAIESEADILLFGGAAGSGKSALAMGLAAFYHKRCLLLRREFSQIGELMDTGIEMLGTRGLNRQRGWYFGNKHLIDLSSCPNPGDENKHAGRPHDLLVFDEVTHFTRNQFTFLQTWVRSTLPGQRCRIVATCNPPNDAEGAWVIDYWGPWLDPKHPRPAKPGELRYYTTIDGQDVEVPDKRPFVLTSTGERDYNFDARYVSPERVLRPMSRTFIPGRVIDNPFLADTGYMAKLQALPEPLRSQMLYGDFSAGRGDAARQVIPSEWVRAAQKRWREQQGRDHGRCDTLGVDVSRGGKDKTTIAPKHGRYFARVIQHEGVDTNNGPKVAALVVQECGREMDETIRIDIVGVGSSPYDSLVGQGKLNVIAMNGGEKSDATDRSGKLRMANKRAEWYWALREALDPDKGDDLALPDDPEVLADLCAPTWQLKPAGILLEPKIELAKRIGRSPDKGDAIVYAHASDGLGVWARM